jgi:glutaminyl-tRNA synthetase
MFEFCVREALNKSALRRMAVLRPLKVVIENYPEGQVEELEAVNHPDDPTAGSRKIKFSRELLIEQDDFMEVPPKKFFRLSPGKEVRLRYAYFITCREVVKNAKGEVTELLCTYDPATKGGNAPDGRKVKATTHWVAAEHAVPAELRVYNQLFLQPDPDVANFATNLNPHSLEVLSEARLEPALSETQVGQVVQFERQGYFCLDPDSAPGKPVFNRTIGLRDTWAKEKAF